MEVNNKIYYLD